MRAGVLAGFLSSRETATEIGLPRSGGCMRADGFARQPIVRMTNVNLEPGGAGSLEDLIADTDDGILIETNRSWSIDNRRLHFQFGGEAAWEIRRRRAHAAAAQPQLRRRDARASGPAATPSARRTSGSWCRCSNCGKGEPGQVARVSHGSAPARFRDVQVGVA